MDSGGENWADAAGVCYLSSYTGLAPATGCVTLDSSAEHVSLPLEVKIKIIFNSQSC